MPRGDKGAYTDKQKRKAEHIKDSYEKRGVSKKEADRTAFVFFASEADSSYVTGEVLTLLGGDTTAS